MKFYFKIMKNKTKKLFCLSIGWLLSLFGITVGNISCAYGPACDEELMKKRADLEAEIEAINQKVHTKENETYDLMKGVNDNNHKIKFLEHERDSLKILLENFEK